MISEKLGEYIKLINDILILWGVKGCFWDFSWERASYSGIPLRERPDGQQAKFYIYFCRKRCRFQTCKNWSVVHLAIFWNRRKPEGVFCSLKIKIIHPWTSFHVSMKTLVGDLVVCLTMNQHKTCSLSKKSEVLLSFPQEVLEDSHLVFGKFLPKTENFELG